MIGTWHRLIKNPDDEELKAPESYTTAGNNRVKEQFHAFQRDADQNNGDPKIQHINPDYPFPPEANYRTKTLKGKAKSDFLKAIGYSNPDDAGYSLGEYLEKFREANEHMNVPTREDFENPAHGLSLLICRNDHSIGLIGKEGSYDKENEDAKSHNLDALVNKIGSSQKGGGFGGGTYGFGKVLFYDHSKCRMVFYYSRLYTPATSVFKSHPGEITRRFIGVNWLHSDIDMGDNSNKRSRKSQFGVVENLDGEDNIGSKGTVVRALYNEAADDAAQAIGLDVREEGDYGTTIVVVEFFNPNAEHQASNEKYLQKIIQSAEYYYYPKLIQKEISISAQIGGRIELPNPDERPEVRDFADAFKKTVRGESTDEFKLETFNVTIPPNPRFGFHEERVATFVLGVKFTDSTESEAAKREEAKPRPNTTAWIRGPGMVIAHDALGIGTIAKEYHAVVLCGDAVKWCEPWLEHFDKDAQRQAERLISLSENVTHDRVSEESKRPEFQNWDKAGSTIRKIRREVRRILKETVAKEASKPEGDAAPMFRLDFGKDGPTSTSRILKIRGLNVEADDSFYLTTFELWIPALSDDDLVRRKGENPLRFSRWRVQIPSQFVREDGVALKEQVRGKVLDFPSVKDMHGTRIPAGHEDLKWDPNETEKPWIEGPFFEEPRRIYIEVETQRQGENLAAFGRLRVKPTTRLGWEEDA